MSCHLQYDQPAGLKTKTKNTHLKGVLLRCFIILLGAHIGLKMYFSICSGPCYFRRWRAHYFGFKECKLSWRRTTTMPLFKNKKPLMHFHTGNVFMGNLKVRGYCDIMFFQRQSCSPTSKDLPSWIVRAIGLRVKSGVDIPSGSSSINCVIMTPGTLDFFLMPN